MSRRVVITGMGCITPLGNTVGEMWRTSKACTTGVVVMHFDAPRYPVKIASQLKNDQLDDSVPNPEVADADGRAMPVRTGLCRVLDIESPSSNSYGAQQLGFQRPQRRVAIHIECRLMVKPEESNARLPYSCDTAISATRLDVAASLGPFKLTSQLKNDRLDDSVPNPEVADADSRAMPVRTGLCRVLNIKWLPPSSYRARQFGLKGQSWRIAGRLECRIVVQPEELNARPHHAGATTFSATVLDVTAFHSPIGAGKSTAMARLFASLDWFLEAIPIGSVNILSDRANQQRSFAANQKRGKFSWRRFMPPLFETVSRPPELVEQCSTNWSRPKISWSGVTARLSFSKICQGAQNRLATLQSLIKAQLSSISSNLQARQTSSSTSSPSFGLVFFGMS